MANPVTHIIVPMLIVETYRRYVSKEKFSKWYVFFVGFMGGVADFDIFYALIKTGRFTTLYHREITHSLLLPIALTLVGIVLYLMYSRKLLIYDGWKINYWLLFLASIGLATHTLLDGIDGFNQWFYPLDWSFVLPNLIYDKYRAAILDGALMLTWLLYDEELFSDILCILKLKK